MEDQGEQTSSYSSQQNWQTLGWRNNRKCEVWRNWRDCRAYDKEYVKQDDNISYQRVPKPRPP
eukprot:12442266-Prorocentrum_lima.AAC.1